MRSLTVCFYIVLFGVASVGCSDDTNPPQADSGPGGNEDGGGSTADAGKLWSCTNPGQPCNAHDPCAITPTCGQDLLCRPARFQDCDDGLPCTQDTCAGLGRCENTPKTGFCVIRNRDNGETECHSEDETKVGEPCAICDPETDPLEWSARNGGSCDDGEACTKDDYCQNGVCKGTDYSADCTDDLTCTVDCDGKGGCITPVIAQEACLIDGSCVSKGAKDATGCGVCDPTVSKTSWTPDGMVCLIDGKCVNSGAKHKDGCAECVPSQDGKGWTVKGDFCLIGDSCKNPSDTDTLGCGECVPAKDKYSWSAIAGKCTIEGRCYDSGDKAPNRDCAECDPTADAKAWTVKGDLCLIDKSCKAPDETDTSGCLSCQPASDKYDWSPVANKCNIEGTCYDEGAEHSSKCLICTYASSKDYWSVKPTAGGSTEAFDASTALPSGWSQTSSDGDVKWQVVTNKGSVSGNNAIYYGDASAENYLGTGGVNNGELMWKGVALPAGNGDKVVLVFKVNLAVETRANFDVLAVYATDKDGKKTLVWDKSSVEMSKYGSWVQQVVDLTSYAGQTVDITFFFHTVDATSNRGKGIYIDDVSIVFGCGG